MTDKEHAWNDLLTLTKDKHSDVRVSVNHSLGKISVFRATNADDEGLLQKELENAIGFFKESYRESTWFKPAEFCFPFYKSYYLVIFKKKEAKEEVKKNLEEAKRAVSGSESKEKLLEVIENLSNALNEAQKLRDMDNIKADLNRYRQYCDRACELLDRTEDAAQGATNLIWRTLPIIDERIQRILAEIRENAEEVCRNTKNTVLEDIGMEVNHIGKDLIDVKDPIIFGKAIDNLLIVLSDICSRMPKKEKDGACELLENAKNEISIFNQITLIGMVLSKVPILLNNNMDEFSKNKKSFF